MIMLSSSSRMTIMTNNQLTPIPTMNSTLVTMKQDRIFISIGNILLFLKVLCLKRVTAVTAMAAAPTAAPPGTAQPHRPEREPPPPEF